MRIVVKSIFMLTLLQNRTTFPNEFPKIPIFLLHLKKSLKTFNSPVSLQKNKKSPKEKNV